MKSPVVFSGSINRKRLTVTYTIEIYIYIYIYIYISKEKSFGDTIANKERNKLLVTIPIEITLSYFCRTFRLS